MVSDIQAIDDPLIDKAQCQRDVDLMKTIGVNTIRVYHVDPDANHDACMKVFADAGIYAMIDMDTFTTYILPVCFLFCLSIIRSDKNNGD